MDEKKTEKKAEKKVEKKKEKIVKARMDEKAKEVVLNNYHSLREKGVSALDAAKQVGVPYITIRSWEKKADGGVSRKRGRPPKMVERRGRPRKVAAQAPKAPQVEAHKQQLTLEETLDKAMAALQALRDNLPVLQALQALAQ